MTNSVSDWYTMEEPPQGSDPELTRYLQDEFLRIQHALHLLHIEGEWYDLLTSTIAAGRRGAATDFDWVDYDTSGIYQPGFSINDDGIANFHINHDIKRGSLMYPHIHWSIVGTDVNPIHWELNYKIAERNDDGVSVFGALITKTLIGTPSGTSTDHIVTETTEASAQLAPEVDAIIIMQIKRVTNGATDTVDEVCAHFADFHYQRERLGTRNKAPDFYK